MLARTHVLVAEQANLGMKLADVTPFIQPPNKVDWASSYNELTWTLSVLGITDGGTIGAPANTLPTAFSITARFEYRQSHSGSTYRMQNPRWSNMFDDEVATHIVEGTPWWGPNQAEPVADPVTGVGDGIICTQATTGYNSSTGLFANPIIVRRTLRHFPQGVRVNMTGSTFTGGTTPRFLIGLEVVGKQS